MPKTHMTFEECLDRWPRVAMILKWHGILSTSEAGVILRDYRDGLPFSCEACSHAGRSPEQFIKDAFRCRAVFRNMEGGSEFYRQILSGWREIRRHYNAWREVRRRAAVKLFASKLAGWRCVA